MARPTPAAFAFFFLAALAVDSAESSFAQVLAPDYTVVT